MNEESIFFWYGGRSGFGCGGKCACIYGCEEYELIGASGLTGGDATASTGCSRNTGLHNVSAASQNTGTHASLSTSPNENRSAENT